jgi:2-methylcitrate dehydratase
LSSGETLTREVHYPKGHAKNPLTDAEVEAKFRELSAGCGNPAQCESALDALRNLESVKNIRHDVLERLALRRDEDARGRPQRTPRSYAKLNLP